MKDNIVMMTTIGMKVFIKGLTRALFFRNAYCEGGDN